VDVNACGRSGRMLAVGLTQGPPHHFWYLALDRYLPGKSPPPQVGVISVGDPGHFGTDPDPRIHISDKRIRIRRPPVTFKMASKNYFCTNFFVYYFLKLHLHNFSKIKSRSHKTEGMKVCLTVFA
jgi:hypothetical protein